MFTKKFLFQVSYSSYSFKESGDGVSDVIYSIWRIAPEANRSPDTVKGLRKIRFRSSQLRSSGWEQYALESDDFMEIFHDGNLPSSRHNRSGEDKINLSSLNFRSVNRIPSSGMLFGPVRSSNLELPAYNFVSLLMVLATVLIIEQLVNFSCVYISKLIQLRNGSEVTSENFSVRSGSCLNTFSSIPSDSRCGLHILFDWLGLENDLLNNSGLVANCSVTSKNRRFVWNPNFEMDKSHNVRGSRRGGLYKKSFPRKYVTQKENHRPRIVE